MNNTNINWLNKVISLITLIIVGWTLISFLGVIKQAPWNFLSVLMAVLGALITILGNYTLQLRKEQIEKKVEIYEQITHTYFEILMEIKSGKKKKNEELTDFFGKITPKLIMWGSDEILSNFRELRVIVYRDQNSEQMITKIALVYGKMLFNIRKDLGYANSGFNKNNFLLEMFFPEIASFTTETEELINKCQQNQIETTE